VEKDRAKMVAGFAGMAARWFESNPDISHTSYKKVGDIRKGVPVPIHALKKGMKLGVSKSRI
jgi:hypothetical protein